MQLIPECDCGEEIEDFNDGNWFTYIDHLGDLALRYDCKHCDSAYEGQISWDQIMEKVE